MKIQYASDLHLEFAENRNFIENGGMEPAGDVLVLAGDVSYLGDRNMIKRRFFDWCSEHFKETLIVKSVLLDDTEFFITTLWTHINPLYLWTIQRGMNDFRHGVLDGARFCANDVDSLHRRCLDWLSSALGGSTAKRKVVVTHHCPTMRSEFNGYPGGALNSAFQVDLDSFIETSGVDYWVYGHTHFAGGSGSKIGGTILLCNQLGYVFQNEHLDFDRKAYFEIVPAHN